MADKEEPICTDAKDLRKLLRHFAKNTFRAKDSDPVMNRIMQKCVELVHLDYKLVEVSNTNGELNPHYPSKIIIMTKEKGNENSCPPDKSMNVFDSDSAEVTKLKDLFNKAKNARCRTRFPLPVILYNGHNICRSATLSGGPEIYGRSGLDYLFFSEDSQPCDQSEDETEPRDWELCHRVRSQDIKLLKALKVGTIVDFMVENKKVKFGVNVTSSEKIDRENRYSDFTIVSLPYPGCEFFKEFRDNNYEADNLVFDWSQGHVDASICIPADSVSGELGIDWSNYKVWDLIALTKNYLQLVIRYIADKPMGLLIHCISGWDRTPLFVSLLRISLWADGVIHKTLNAKQILYLTIAYDWMLFGHHLSDRLSKGEEIFFFCFYFLKYIYGVEYSVLRKCTKRRRIDSDPVEEENSEPEPPLDLQECNMSLNSSWSSISSKSQETPPAFFHSEDHNYSSHNMSNLSCSESTKLYAPKETSQNSCYLTIPTQSQQTSSTSTLRESTISSHNCSSSQNCKSSHNGCSLMDSCSSLNGCSSQNGSSPQIFNNLQNYDNLLNYDSTLNCSSSQNGTSPCNDHNAQCSSSPQNDIIFHSENNSHNDSFHSNCSPRSDNNVPSGCNPQNDNGFHGCSTVNDGGFLSGCSPQYDNFHRGCSPHNDSSFASSSPKNDISFHSFHSSSPKSDNNYQIGCSLQNDDSFPNVSNPLNLSMSSDGSSPINSCTPVNGSSPRNLPENKNNSGSITSDATPPKPIFNRNTRTSPVAVPTRSVSRQRSESTSSLNTTGSWQIISETGSLRGSGSTSGSHMSLNHSRTPLRQKRLQSVREAFYKCYHGTIGFKVKEGAQPNSIGNLVSHIADKVWSSQKDSKETNETD